MFCSIWEEHGSVRPKKMLTFNFDKRIAAVAMYNFEIRKIEVHLPVVLIRYPVRFIVLKRNSVVRQPDIQGQLGLRSESPSAIFISTFAFLLYFIRLHRITDAVFGHQCLNTFMSDGLRLHRPVASKCFVVFLFYLLVVEPK